MSTKKKNDSPDTGLGEFDDWFADGESGAFWNDEAPAGPDPEELARQEAERLEAERLEAERREAERAEAARREAARQEAERQEAARQEAARQEAARQEAARQEAARQEAERQEAARAEAERAEAARQEAEQRAEAARQEAARQEAEQRALLQEAERAAERIRLSGLTNNPTIIADLDEGWPDPETEVEETPAPVQVEAPPTLAIGTLAEDDDAEATAEDFVGSVPDPTMILRRAARSDDAPSEKPTELFSAEEVAQARAERETRRRAQTVVLPPSRAPAEPTLPPPAPSAQAVVPDSATARWQDGVKVLEQEAAARVGQPGQGILLAAAGLIAFERLGDWEAAEQFLGAAHSLGVGDARVLRALADITASKGEFEALRDLLVARAEVSAGPLAAEALQDAALVERNSLRQPDRALALLQRALEADPTDWFALRLMRELRHRAQDWAGLEQVLRQMAQMVSGARRARLAVERARLLEERLAQPEAAIVACREALEADPSCTTAFLALERLLRSEGRSADLAALYRQRASICSGADAVLWLSRAIRAEGEVGQALDLAALCQAAGVAGPGELPAALRDEARVRLEREGRLAELASLLRDEAAHQSGSARAWSLWAAARLLSTKPDAAEDALRAMLDAAEADADAEPVLEAALALLGRLGRHDQRSELLVRMAERSQDPTRRVGLLYRLGEIQEVDLRDLPAARATWESVLQLAAGYQPALEGLERVCSAMGDGEGLIAVVEQRAIQTEEPGAVALHLYRAGRFAEQLLGDTERAADYYRRSLEAGGEHQPALDALVRLLEARGDRALLAQVLATASEGARDPAEAVSLGYRAARLWMEVGTEPERARALLERCLHHAPGFSPALVLLLQQAHDQGDHATVANLERMLADACLEAGAKSWHRLAAAEALAEVEGEAGAQARLEELLDADPSFPPALASLCRLAMRGADPHARVAVLQRMAFGCEDDARRAELGSRVADHALEAGDVVTAMNSVAEVLASEATGRPLMALATLAEGANYWEEAQKALLSVGDRAARVELARVQETWIEDPNAAARTWSELLAEDPSDVDAAAGLERCLARAGRREGLAQAHGVLAAHLPDGAVAAVHALLAGHLHEAEGRFDEAVANYQRAFLARPVPGKAFDALRRVHAQRRDMQALEAVFAQLPDGEPYLHASTLEECEAHAAAVAIYDALLARPGLDEAERLAILTRREPSLIAMGEWMAVFRSLGERLELSRSPEQRAAIEAQRRYVLAEHLAQTDEAWELYRQLHEADPRDVEVLEALARIAGARGETRLAIQYLSGLAEGSVDPSTSARYQRRIAEAWLVAGEPGQAREALLRALDHEPGDLDSLRLLRELAAKAEDWPGVVGALAREATLRGGVEQVECYREIARIWQDRIGNAAVARDAWRKVLEAAPDDAEAATRLLDLARAEGAWAQVVEFGSLRVRHLHGAEQSELLYELGRVQLERLHREDEAIRLLDAASRAEVPSLGAAQMLERLHSSRGQWDRVAEAIQRQANASEGAARVALLSRLAELRAEALQDRRGAAQAYAEILRQEPDNRKALRYRGDHLFEEGDLSGAVEAWSKMGAWEEESLDLDDFDDRMDAALFNFRKGEAERRLERNDAALASFQRALRFNGSHLPSLEALGPLLMAREDWEGAGEVYRQILQLIGGQAEPDRLCRTYANLGIIELRQGQLDKAKKRFARALELKSNDIPALTGMAGVLFARKDWNNLLNVYNNIIYHAQEPADVVNAYVTKGFILDARLNLPDKAAQHYEKGLAFNPSEPRSLLRLAELSLRRQDWAEAGSLAERGLLLDDLSGVLRAGLLLVKAVAHGAVGDGAAAEQARSEALALDASLVADLPARADAETIHGVLRARLQAEL